MNALFYLSSKAEVDANFHSLTYNGLKIIDEGTIEINLGILITDYDDGSFRMLQPHLIERLISSISSMKDARSATTPASTCIILTNNINGEAYMDYWDYRSVICMLNHLLNCKYLTMLYAVHQYARFYNDPKHAHGQAVPQISNTEYHT